jgi:hypothetical protein
MKLNNGVLLLARVMKEEDGFEMTKAEVRKIFLGKGRVAHCVCRDCWSPHKQDFPVHRMESAISPVHRMEEVISIGCYTFRTEDVAKIQKWLKSKAKEMKNETNR